MLKDLSDDQFFAHIFTSEDRLGMDYVNEARRRKENMVPFLSKVLLEEENYKSQDEKFWGVVHAVYILGILADMRGFDGLLSASKLAWHNDIDWIWDALPECYLRLGREVLPRLMDHVEKNKASDFEAISSEVYGLWNLWDAYPEEREKIEAFLLGILKDPAIKPEARANLIADFAQINRKDLKSLFEDYYERGEVDLETLTRADLDSFYENVHRIPGFRYDLEVFYSTEAIEDRKKRWEKEDQEEVQGRERSRVESFILENYKSISRNAPCPCGSGKKFKKCHLHWAEEELLGLSAKEGVDEDFMAVRAALSKERGSESALRRFLARKGKTALFSEIREGSLKLIKSPQSELLARGFGHFLGPIMSKINFENKEELEEFTKILMEYHNALAAQFPPDYPRGKMSFH
jgi:hypothetical protein